MLQAPSLCWGKAPRVARTHGWGSSSLGEASAVGQAHGRRGAGGPGWSLGADAHQDDSEAFLFVRSPDEARQELPTGCAVGPRVFPLESLGDACLGTHLFLPL